MTLARRHLDDEFLSQWGCIILDEAHHCPAQCFQEVMTQFPAYYRFGATATPRREDNLQGLLYAICGPVIAKVQRRALKAAGLIVDPVVMVEETGFSYPYTNMRQWQPMVRSLIHDRRRNAQIIENIITRPWYCVTTCSLSVAKRIEPLTRPLLAKVCLTSTTSLTITLERRAVSPEELRKIGTDGYGLRLWVGHKS